MRAWGVALAMSGSMLLAAGVLASGCGKAKPTVEYAGKELAPLLGADQVRLFAGRTPPDEHTVIGVVTTRCETINDSAGVLAGTCSHPALREAAKQHAAAVGGTGLLDLKCDRKQMEREFTRQDAGQSRIDIRHMMRCRATVVRGPVDTAALQATAQASVSAKPGARTLTIGEIELEVAIERDGDGGTVAPRKPRKPEEVGELNEVPQGVVQLAKVSARCLRGCARNIPQRALRVLAGEVGALVIADKRCKLVEDRWQCSAVALHEAPVQPAPSRDKPPAAPEPASTADDNGSRTPDAG